MGPLVAPAGTVAVIEMSELTVKLPAPTLMPPNFTSLAPVRPVPLIVPASPEIRT